jgi:dUTP pyrophosphatase
MNNIQVYKLDKLAILPQRNHTYDAGIDIFASQDTFVPTGTTVKVPTGVAIRIPDGYVGKIEDRSSYALKGLRTGAGVVDSGYSGELSIVIHNLNNSEHTNIGQQGYMIRKGDKIAQLLTYEVATPMIEETNYLWESTRGSKGFGSSGK